MRAIIRISIDNETNGALRNALRDILQNAGFHLTPATGTYENTSITMSQLKMLMQEFWQTAAHPDTVPSLQNDAHVDHVWFYTDETE